ncbi:hypothetical protein PQX77_006789, partial [Marasmius sp. AFHP31]
MLGYLTGEIYRSKSIRATQATVTQTTAPEQSTDSQGEATPTPTPTAPPAQTLPVTPTPFYSVTPSVEEWDARDCWVTSVIISNTIDPIGVGIDETRWAYITWLSLCR